MAKQTLAALFLLAHLFLAGCGGSAKHAALRFYDAEAAHAAFLTEDGAAAVDEAETLLELSKQALQAEEYAESDRLAALALLRVRQARASLRAAQLRTETKAVERALEETAASADLLRTERNKAVDERNALEGSDESN